MRLNKCVVMEGKTHIFLSKILYKTYINNRILAHCTVRNVVHTVKNPRTLGSFQAIDEVPCTFCL